MQKLHRALNYSNILQNFSLLRNVFELHSHSTTVLFFSYISFYSHALALDFLTLTVFEYLLIPSLIRERNGRWRACLDAREEQLRGEKNFTLTQGMLPVIITRSMIFFFFFFKSNSTISKRDLTKFKIFSSFLLLFLER